MKKDESEKSTVSPASLRKSDANEPNSWRSSFFYPGMLHSQIPLQEPANLDPLNCVHILADPIQRKSFRSLALSRHMIMPHFEGRIGYEKKLESRLEPFLF